AILSGELIVKGTADGVDPENLNLFIDGVQVDDTFLSTEEAYFVFYSYGGIDKGYQNALTTGHDVISLITDGPKNQTVILPVERLHPDENVLDFRSGSKEAPYFEDNPPEGSLDNFDAGNVRLILPDGTVLRDAEYGDSRFGMGTYGSNLPVRKFHFNVQPDNITSTAYEWNTTSIADGEHQIKVTGPDQQAASATVLIDNTKPSIKRSLQDGKVYTGDITIDPTVQDETSGIKNVNVKLDGENIVTPYRTSSTKLSTGEHVVKVTAIDKAGNLTEQTIQFQVRKLAEPELVSPKDGADKVSTNPELSVRIVDKAIEDANVTFYEGQSYTAEDASMQVFQNATPSEPPKESTPQGEKGLTAEEKAKVSAADGEFLVQDSTKEFPYVRFQVQLSEDISPDSTVELSWEGKSLPGRQVTLYGWNDNKNKWVTIDSFVPESEETFTLSGKVNVADYARDNKINVIVQDQIPQREDYDYTFVWMTDTQYYSALYPDVFQSEVNWLKDTMDDLNTKYVFHTGDIVNAITQDYQWKRASRFLSVLDEAKVPYGLLAGDHDTGYHPRHVNDYSVYRKYFGADRYQDRPYYGGTYKDNRGHYDLISAGGNDYIMVYMGWGIGDEEINWMNQVLASHADRKAILCFHQYLYNDGTRSALGNRIFEEVVKTNENVIMTLNGHRKVARRVDQIDDDGDGSPDRKVYQLMANYQSGPKGGSGYMTLLHFDTDSDKIYVNTYSPYKDDYMRTPEAEFTLDLNLDPMVKRVATDYFDVNVFTGKEIETVENVASGEIAKVTWNDLKGDQTYYWYVSEKISGGGEAVSDMWGFTTLVTLPAIRQKVDGYKDSDELTGPLAEQLTYKLTQAEHFYDKGSIQKAGKKMNDFLKLLNNESMQAYISEEAKDVLNDKVKALFAVWSTR
ncbi:MAG TPA: metallophosphoesterase, partial [Bacillales bacterium]|nr:metallophosphoesterase [Bacillales bacterium]